MIKVKVKVICIKKYIIEDFSFNIGDNALILEYSSGGIYLGIDSKNDAIPMWIVDENVYKHFITPAQYREEQINSILND